MAATPWPDNRVALTGEVVDDPRTRTSPAGVAVTRFTLEHGSEQPESGERRQTRFRVAVHARGGDVHAVARELRPGSQVRVAGHLAHSGRRPQQQRLVIVARRIQLQTEQES